MILWLVLWTAGILVALAVAMSILLFLVFVASVVAALIGKAVAPADLRRNLAIAGINLFSLKNRRFRIGQAVLADHRNEQATLQFLQAHLAERGFEAETTM